MTIAPWPGDRLSEAEHLRTELAAAHETNELLLESVRDLEQLAIDDRGWDSLARSVADEFTYEGRRKLRTMCRTAAVSNPLIKRALNLRIGYIWGQGVEVTCRPSDDIDPEVVQQVNDLIRAFDEDNDASLTGSQACEELERAEGTDGEVYLACFTSPLTGRVQVRSTPADEIVELICNPEDRDEPWFYIREFTKTVLEPGAMRGNTRSRAEKVREAHPALDYRPSQRIKTLDRATVRWDAPMLHVPVNRLDGWKHGIPDVYASVAYARMYRDFIVDWAVLVRSLSKFAWKATGDTRGRAAKAAAAARALPAPPSTIAGTSDAGGYAAIGPGNDLTPIPKTGATIDSNSGRPLAAMVAAGLGVPVTMLLADPGVTGARATAETLDKPTILEMGMRRLLWQSARERILRHVIAASIEAPQGRLVGTVRIDDWGRRHTLLASNVEPGLEWTWPPLADLDPKVIVDAIVAADSTGKMPPLTTVRLLLSALGVPDVDDLLEQVIDEDGNWVDPDMNAGQAAIDRHRRGGDAAEAYR